MLLTLQKNFCFDLNEACYIAEKKQQDLSLKLLNYGTHRGLYILPNNELLKVPLTFPSLMSNISELELWTKVPNFLKHWLCPIIKQDKAILTVPLVDTSKPVDDSIIVDTKFLFADNGFDLDDIAEQKQWGWFNNHPVILDYGLWKLCNISWEERDIQLNNNLEKAKNFHKIVEEE